MRLEEFVGGDGSKGVDARKRSRAAWAEGVEDRRVGGVGGEFWSKKLRTLLARPAAAGGGTNHRAWCTALEDRALEELLPADEEMRDEECSCRFSERGDAGRVATERRNVGLDLYCSLAKLDTKHSDDVPIRASRHSRRVRSSRSIHPGRQRGDQVH